jgi:D-sedoheptulose 7-phosphate isomerase
MKKHFKHKNFTLNKFGEYFNLKTKEVSKNFDLFSNDKQINNLFSIIKLLINKINLNGKIIFCGNGGSAADSQHLAAELVGQFLNHKRKAISAISLTTNTSIITSISNDINYESIFSRQIEAVGNQGDILFAISTSGKSKNINRAIRQAKKQKMIVILLTGSRKIINKQIDYQINVPAVRVDRIQEMHIFVGHIICDLLEKNI